MIVYFDSSSIVKWFFDEALAELARDVKEKAEIVVTSLIAFPEVLSAFNRACGEDRCMKTEVEVVRIEFLRIWPQLQWIKVDEELIRRAGDLVFEQNLRGFDAVHLASALLLKQEDAEIDLFFSCFDHNLNRAAQEKGFLTHEL